MLLFVISSFNLSILDLFGREDDEKEDEEEEEEDEEDEEEKEEDEEENGRGMEKGTELEIEAVTMDDNKVEEARVKEEEGIKEAVKEVVFPARLSITVPKYPKIYEI